MTEAASLREETRYFGRVLGRVLRDQAGIDGYERIERIRQEAVRFRRAGRAEAQAVRAGLEAQLNALAPDQTLDVVRAFSYFLHLLNVAEDRQTNRLALERESAAPEPGNFDFALASVRASSAGGAELDAWLARAMIVPVLGASDRSTAAKHPGLRARHRRRAVAAGGRAAERGGAGARRGAAAARVLTLWQTAMIRLSRLRVIDEIENALSFYRLTFLTEIPRLYEEMEAALGGKPLRCCCAWVPGSAATATAIPSSPPKCCARR